MWQFKATYYDPVESKLRVWIGRIGFTNFLHAYVAGVVAVDFPEIAFPEWNDDMIIQDLDVFMEVWFDGEEEDSEVG